MCFNARICGVAVRIDKYERFLPSVRVRPARSIACVRVVPFVVCGWFRLVELERRIVLPKFGNTDGYFGGWLLCEPGVAVSVAPVFSRQMTVCCNQGGHFLSRWFLLLLGRGRVKRRSPPIIEQFTVAVGVEAVRRLRINYSESNKIAHFHQGNEFSHGCAGRPARSRWCKSTAMKE